MKIKLLATMLLATSVLSAPALAQNAPANQPGNAPAATSNTRAQNEMVMKEGQWRAFKLKGLDVYNNNNDKIGDIRELITDQSGKIDLVVIGVGGFLGLGEHDVALPWNQVKFEMQPRRANTAARGAPAGTAANTTGAASNTTTAPAANTAATNSAVTGNREYPDHAIVNATKDQLKAMPAFRYTSRASNTRQ